MRILVLAAHPDDETVGCGGTIAKHVKKNDQVYLCIVTKAYTPDWSAEILRKIKKEVQRANKILGIRKVYYLDFPTVKLDTIPQKELNASISKIVNEVNPEIIYMPYKGDLNKDHRLVFEATLVAARPIGKYRIKRILSYETLSSTEWGYPIDAFVPNIYVDISSTLSTKLKAVRAYGSQLRPYPHARSLPAINALARKRGAEIGVASAEAFFLVREFVE